MRAIILLLVFSAFHSNAVVMRHDKPAKSYALQQAPDYLIDMPHEGHGVLIHPQWIVTVAHTLFYDYTGKSIKIGDTQFEIEQVHIHPDYVKASQTLFTGDAAPLMRFLASRSDIALVKLSSPVTKLTPIDIYSGVDEKGKTITVFGRGAVGNGVSGENIDTKRLRALHHFTNIVETAEGNWLTFVFDQSSNALPLEGMHGSGDSGGASVVHENAKPSLVGLTSWQVWRGDLAEFKGGLYGTIGYQVRVSSFREWINSVIEDN